jgi:hypothetical protein
VRGFKPGSLAENVAWMTWSRSLRVIARVWLRIFDLAAWVSARFARCWEEGAGPNTGRG